MSRFMPSIHTSKYEIKGSDSNILAGKRILIGMTGSVAILETINLARLLMRNDADVYIAMTHAATELVNPHLAEWATGNPVITKLTGQVEHVHLCGLHPDKADLLLIAPSTANTIGKIANGIDDTVVTTCASTALGTGIPIAIVPAMHLTMYKNPTVVKNIETLKKIGIRFIGPRIEEGKAKIARNEEILEEVIAILTPKDLAGKKVVVTAGPSRVWMDDIRYISNPSTGRMGVDLALDAASRGAEVVLLLGLSPIEVPSMNIKTIRFETPQDIINAIDKISNIDIYISAAAISDYEPEKYLGKIPSKQETLTLKFKPVPKIIDYVKQKFPQAQIVGFKAEVKLSSEQLVQKGKASLEEHKIDMVIANLVDKPGQGFASKTNDVFIVKRDGSVRHLSLETKRFISKIIFDELLNLST